MTDQENPIADSSTTRPRAGLVWKDRREFPGLVLLLLAVLGLAALATAATMADAGWVVGLGIFTAVTGVGGVVWILAGRRRTTADSGRHQR